MFTLPLYKANKIKGMFNQLVHSSQREKKLKRQLYNDFLKQTQQIDSPPLLRNQSTLRDKQLQIHEKLLSNSLDGPGPSDLSQVIKRKLQSKKVEYPNDVMIRFKSPSRNISTEGVQIHSPENFSKKHNHDSIKRSRRRMKTLVDDSPASSQEEDQPYKRTLEEIDELNHIFFANTKRKAKKHLHLLQIDTPQPQRRPHRQFYHISRQHDFQQYINHLEKQHSRERYTPTPVREKVREVTSQKKMEERPVARIELPASPESRKKETFIRILQKVKARGESLLVKLNKFPSLKRILQ